jgi:hypothetical protein
VRCPPTAFPAAIRLERRRRHVPSQKAAPKKTTEFHAHPKDLHMARMSHQQLGQDQWLRCPSWVKMRKTQHEQMFSAVPPIADILGKLRFGFVEMQQARLHSITAHYANYKTSTLQFSLLKYGLRACLSTQNRYTSLRLAGPTRERRGIQIRSNCPPGRNSLCRHQ